MFGTDGIFKMTFEERETMKKTVRTTILMGICIASIVILSFVFSQFFSDKTDYSASGILLRIQDISQLNTVEMYFNEIIDYKNAKYFKNQQIPFTEKSFIFTVKARVQAGVNLQNIKEQDVEVNDRNLTIKIKKPEITTKEILSYKAYDEKDGLFNEITNEDTLKALEAFKLDIENQAIENGIIEKSMRNTEKTFEQLFLAAGFKSVKVEWK